MKKSVLISVILSIILSIAALIVGLIAIIGNKEHPIKDAYQIGLGSFFADTITSMYVSEGSDPNLRGEFFNEHILNQVRETFTFACFQESDIKDISDAGGGLISNIQFKGQYAEYSFSIGNGLIQIRINDERSCYNTNIGYAVNQIIIEAATNYLTNE